ncbi:Alkanesulfonates transport system permease protein [Rhodovastum atsumiense]|uniref:ABC transporter permease n=1 Tax=Rhodovastum atsumiense TaxID=504468 RepID=A0A5M6IK70_9PROT|nr:ABC transporter permease [Rhodovastum atsumiense]KAA5608572.1 ABC transporter permease [Rhodovastum atsumiense]CAH2598788.1 Alkanesulfonates transport system permease protein [Rhodovastum atsumiense]
MKAVARGLVLPLLLLGTWELASHGGLVDARILPSPEHVLATALRELTEGDLLYHLLVSLGRDLAGFIVGSALGIAIGTLLGLSPLAGRLILPSFNGLRQIAILAWIPLISLWFGFGDSAKIAFITLAALIPAVLNTYEGIQSAPARLVEVATALCFTRWQRITRLYLPSAMPSIATGLHLALIYSWVASVGAEYFMTLGPGIGGLIIAGRERFQMDLVILGMVVLGLVGFLINQSAQRVERRLLRWRG